MQISRHWRMNSQRYRLQGVRYEDGQVALQDRPMKPSNDKTAAAPKAQSSDLEYGERVITNRQAAAVA